MKSQVAARLKLKYDPVAVLFTQEKPDQALEFAEEKWGCAAAMLTAAMKGKTIAFSRKTFGCLGGGVGLGFGDQYVHFPGGITHFLSTGRGEGYPPGEAYKKTPELAQSFVDSLPMTDIPAEFVVLKPLSAVEPAVETPQVVVFYANPDQLSALVVLTNYGRVGCNNVTIPFAAGCQSTCLQRTVNSSRSTCLRLHFHYFNGLTKDIFLPLSSPFINGFRHWRRRSNRINCSYICKRI